MENNNLPQIPQMKRPRRITIFGHKYRLKESYAKMYINIGKGIMLASAALTIYTWIIILASN